MDLAQQVETDHNLKEELKTDPQAALAKQAAAAYTSDPVFYRIAIFGLIGIIALVIISALIVQLWKDKALSDWESALATTALGGLVGLLAPSPTEN
jgi:uncharacterized membrane protein YhaH (DUF805 family)